jgi:hypothetical protein
MKVSDWKGGKAVISDAERAFRDGFLQGWRMTVLTIAFAMVFGVILLSVR